MSQRINSNNNSNNNKNEVENNNKNTCLPLTFDNSIVSFGGGEAERKKLLEIIESIINKH